MHKFPSKEHHVESIQLQLPRPEAQTAPFNVEAMEGTSNARRAIKCISRESNPGHIDGNDVFYH